MIYVKPKQGLRVRHPQKPESVIAEHGAWMNESTQLTRLINDGDLLVDESKKYPEDTKKTTKPTTSKGGK